MARVSKRVGASPCGRSAHQQQRPGIKQPTSRCCQQPKHQHQHSKHKQQQQP